MNVAADLLTKIWVYVQQGGVVDGGCEGGVVDVGCDRGVVDGRCDKELDDDGCDRGLDDGGVDVIVRETRQKVCFYFFFFVDFFVWKV